MEIRVDRRRSSSLRRAVRLLPPLLLLACGDSPSDPGGGETVVIDGPATLSFDHLGQQSVLTASTTTGDAIRWSSSLSSVATVQEGVVTARGDGSAFIIASAGGAADSVQVMVSQVATALEFLSPPGGAVRGAPFPDPVRVAVIDAGGSPVLSHSGAVSVSLEGGGGAASLQGTLTRSLVGGIAFFDDLSIDAAGSGFRLTATLSGSSLKGHSAPFDIVDAPDLVVGRNLAVQEIGVLIDGATASGDFNDLGRVVLDSVVQVVALPGESNEVVAFTRRRPPALVQADWTLGVDTVAVTFPDPIEIPVTVWVIKGPYEEQKVRAANAIATTSLIWDEERMGLDFSEVEFVDATAKPGASAFYDLTLCNQQAQITSAIGKREGRINIYYVGTVDGGTDRGRACAGGDFTVMAERSGHELLSHEIGHLFGLGHIDGDGRFDRTNVMHSASNTRRYLTEGQVFRQHFNGFSALSTVYAARTDAHRTCPDFAANAECPSLARRLWSDGAFPANDEVAGEVVEWLTRTCTAGEGDEAGALRAAGDAAIEPLRDAALAGPPAGVLRAVRQAERDRAAAIRARLAAGATFGLDPLARAGLVTSAGETAETRAAEVARSWREAAVRALGSIGSAPAIAVLDQLADSGDPDLAVAARRALRR